MRTVEVEILGQRLKIRSNDAQEHIEGLARYVNEKIAQAQQGAQAAATHSMIILVALNIADELFKVRAKESARTKELETRIEKLLVRLRSQPGTREETASPGPG